MEELLYGFAFYSSKLEKHGYELLAFSYSDDLLNFRVNGSCGKSAFKDDVLFSVYPGSLELAYVKLKTSFGHIKNLIEIEKEVLNQLYNGQ